MAVDPVGALRIYIGTLFGAGRFSSSRCFKDNDAQKFQCQQARVRVAGRRLLFFATIEWDF